MRYLVDWAYALYGRSGSGMEGVAPLSYTTVAAWSQLTDTAIRPHEVDALMALDAAIRNPDGVKDEEVVAPVETPAWPTRTKE